MNVKPILKYLQKSLSEYESVPKLFNNVKLALRRENTIGNHAGSVSRKFIRPAIYPKALEVARKEVGDYLMFPTGKLSNGNSISEYIKDSLSSGSKNVPLRSKNPIIDKISKEMLDSRNDMKNFLQSRFYRKLLRKNGINEKHYIQNTENNLDEIYNYIIPSVTNPNNNGTGGIRFTALNHYGNPKLIHIYMK